MKFSTPARAFQALLLLGGGVVAPASPPIVEFDRDVGSTGQSSIDSHDGAVALSWNRPAPPWTVELQQAPTGEFSQPVMRYRGSDRGSVLTGLPEGTHHFRVRSTAADGASGPWSPTLEAQVTFMDRGQLFLLLALGGIVVLLTAGAILAGHVRARANRAAGMAAPASS